MDGDEAQIVRQNPIARWVLRLFLKLIGWGEGQLLDVPWEEFIEFKCFPMADEILSKYFGLKINGVGLFRRGGACSVHVDPRLVGRCSSELARLKARSEAHYFPIGTTHDGDGILLLKDTGEVYLWGEMIEPLRLGSTFDAALLRLLTRGG